MKQTSTYGKRILAFLMVVAMLVVNLPAGTVHAVSVNEDGYIEVRTVAALYNIRNDLTANYILMNDIDLTAATAKGGDWDFMGNGWNPIGSNDIYSNSAFSGEFDGNGHKIIGMRIAGGTMPSGAGAKYVGLFANVTGSVHDLDFENASIVWSKSGYGYIGTVAGMNSGNIYNIHVDTAITSTAGVDNSFGGIVGKSSGTISRCSNTGNVQYEYAYTSGSAIDYNTGAGGIVGNNDKGTVEYCYNTGSIRQYNTASGSEGYVGGICGAGTGTVRDCYNTGAISTSETYYAAGICGGDNAATIKNCYNTGSISSSAQSIAFQTTNAGSSISNCYYLSGMGKSNRGATALIAGQLKLQSSYSGFDFNSIWVMDPNAVYPYPQLRNNVQDLRVIDSITVFAKPFKTEYVYNEKLDLTGGKIQVTYKEQGIEFVEMTADMVSGYNATEPGTQTLTVSYLNHTATFEVVVKEKVYTPIYTIEDLYNIRNDMDGFYILMNDIDLTEATAKGGDWDFNGCGWNPIGSNDVYGDAAFSGELNGNGYKIIGMRIDVSTVPSGTGAVHLGLFANVTGSVHDLTFEDGSISYTYESSEKDRYAGFLAGKASGALIENIACKGGTISLSGGYGGYAYAGGLLGVAQQTTISQCSNSAYIYAKTTGYSYSSYASYAGGMVGKATSNVAIERSFNTGNVTVETKYTDKYCKSNGYAGGICGYQGAITMCYNTGNVKITGVTNPDLVTVYASGICNSGTASQCYNTGTVSHSAIGGTVTNSYYLADSGKSSTGATSLTETQMRISSMYPGFDFTNDWILNAYANHPYPQLRSNIQDLSESAEYVSIVAAPMKTDYLTGDTIDLTGCLVEVKYISGRVETVNATADMLSGYDPETVGEQHVTVTIAGASDYFVINVARRPVVTAIEVISQPDKTEFAIGTAFDFTGAKIKVSYQGGTTEEVPVTVDMTSGGDIRHLGEQTITVNFYGATDTFKVKVVGVTVEKIQLKTLPNKVTYKEGEALDLTGMALTVLMNNGVESEITSGYTISGYSSEPGTHTITITYYTHTVTFDVTVAARQITELVLKAKPTKTEYFSGDELDLTGMMVVATYDNGDIVVAENYTVSGYDGTPGRKTVVINVEGKVVAFPVNVIERVITDFAITSYPAKLSYIENESLSTDGLVVMATYNDGATVQVTDYEVVGFSSNPGTHTLSVVFGGWVESFDIEVAAKEMTKLVVTPPIKLSYYLGEEFDSAGLVVTACYNNGQQFDVNDYDMTGFDSNTAGTKTITVTYGGMSSSFAISVNERSEIKTEGSFTVANKEARLGEQVVVPVTVSKNTGLAGLVHTLSFDKTALKLVKVEFQGDYANGTMVLNEEKLDEGLLTVLWFSDYDVVSDGVVYNLTFEVLETAADGVTDVKIEFQNNGNANVSGENVIFKPNDGSVEVKSYWLGDLNGDRLYKMVDLVMLAQYVAGFEMELSAKQLLSADVNEDTIIDIHDVVLLNQWLLEQDA